MDFSPKQEKVAVVERWPFNSGGSTVIIIIIMIRRRRKRRNRRRITVLSL